MVEQISWWVGLRRLAGMPAVGSGKSLLPLLVAVSSVLCPYPSFPRYARCTWIRWQHASVRRWASSIPRAVAHLVQAAVLGSRVAQSNLWGHLLPNNSVKPKLLRNSA